MALDEAPDRAWIGVLWLAHGPDGDGLWGDEHQAAGVARYNALPASDEWPDLDGVPADEDDGGDVPTPPEDPARYPVTITDEGWTPDLIMLWCHECLLPPGHPQADDPVAWCDCQDGETCLDAAVSCRRRAHDPDECPSPFKGSDDDPAGPPAEPGPFDGTMDLADLRDLIEQALSTETLDELYDAHGPVSEGGDGLWTDDLNAPAQAAYDRLSASTSGTGAEPS